MFVDLLPFETNRLLVHFAAFGSVLCVAAYVASKIGNAEALATALTRYAQAIAVAIMLFMSLSTICMMLLGITTPHQLRARATTSFQAWSADMATLLHLPHDNVTGESAEDDQAATRAPISA